MATIYLHNATIVNEGRQFVGSVLIENDLISRIIEGDSKLDLPTDAQIIELEGKYLLPGVIDDQVHFREPGLTQKADIASESRAAVAGGVTSFMDMPNTKPQTTTIELLEEKYALAAEKSVANYSFYMGATNDNLNELKKVDGKKVCGIKLFMGSSTGNMLVDNEESLISIFSQIRLLIAVHCEDEATIQANLAAYKAKYGDDIPAECHPLIRSSEACYKSTQRAIKLATNYNTRLHLLHLSTVNEMNLLRPDYPLRKKQITAEVCVHHLWFDDSAYKTKGSFVRWNPAVKTAADRDALFEALLNDRLDVVATDHSPHTIEEKSDVYTKTPSGGPLVQHSLLVMLEFARRGKISIERVVEKMSHAVAEIFQIKQRGYIREGYFADLVVVDLQHSTKVTKENILYKCGWSPFEGEEFGACIEKTFVNGNLVFDNGKIIDTTRGRRLEFER